MGSQLMEITMTPATARLELLLLDAESEATSSSDFYIWLRESGLSPEAAIRMKELINVTARIGTKVVSLGKVLVLKLIEFVKAHQNLAVGVALGAAVATFIGSIPLLGPLLAPIALVLGIGIGAVAGHRVDKAAGTPISQSINPISITQDIIEIAREFFRFFIELIHALRDELLLSESSAS
jgi:hypothetical protein